MLVRDKEGPRGMRPRLALLPTEEPAVPMPPSALLATRSAKRSSALDEEEEEEEDEDEKDCCTGGEGVEGDARDEADADEMLRRLERSVVEVEGNEVEEDAFVEAPSVANRSAAADDDDDDDDDNAGLLLLLLLGMEAPELPRLRPANMSLSPPEPPAADEEVGAGMGVGEEDREEVGCGGEAMLGGRKLDCESTADFVIHGMAVARWNTLRPALSMTKVPPGVEEEEEEEEDDEDGVAGGGGGGGGGGDGDASWVVGNKDKEEEEAEAGDGSGVDVEGATDMPANMSKLPDGFTADDDDDVDDDDDDDDDDDADDDDDDDGGGGWRGTGEVKGVEEEEEEDDDAGNCCWGGILKDMPNKSNVGCADEEEENDDVGTLAGWTVEGITLTPPAGAPPLVTSRSCRRCRRRNVRGDTFAPFGLLTPACGVASP